MNEDANHRDVKGIEQALCFLTHWLGSQFFCPAFRHFRLEQGSQTRGPPDAFVQPANISKTE